MGGNSSFGSFGSHRSSRSSSSGSNSSFGNSSGTRTDQQNSKDNRQRENSRARNSNLRGKSRGTPAPGQTPGGKQTSVKGKPAPAKTGPGSGTNSPNGATNVEFKIKADASANLLMVESADSAPTMNMNAMQGSKFATRTVFRNARKSEFKSVDASLKYDPQIIEPIGIDDSMNEKLLAKLSLAKVDQRKGILAYHADYKDSPPGEQFVVFRVEWKAVSPASNTGISFLNTEDFPSRILKEGVNVLQPTDEASEAVVSDMAGLLGATVSVTPDAATAGAIDEAQGSITGIQLAHNISQGTAKGGINLSLRPRQNQITVGQEFLVDVVYSNPMHADLDMVKLDIRFDPKVLQVVDYDNNGWITRGLNIFDGDYHDDFPFDFHVKNIAYNNSGQILYEMGLSTRVRVPTSGVLATIRFKAVAPASSTEIAFRLDEEDTSQQTAISFLGFNLIGTPGRRTAALSNAAVSLTQ